MKNNMTKSLIGSGLALTVAAAVWFPMFSSAEQIKGGQLLNTKSLPATSTAAVAPARTMACPQCKDVFTSRVDTTKGAIKPVVLVEKHLCASCRTSVQTAGVAKHATEVAIHTCSMGGAELASCCK